MKIDEAIDRNVELKAELIREGRLEEAKSVELGIEALEREQYHRSCYPLRSPSLFPGETEE